MSSLPPEAKGSLDRFGKAFAWMQRCEGIGCLRFNALGEEKSVKKIAISKIFESFHELERAIKRARTSIEQNNKPDQKMIERLDQYEDILEKQKSLATALCGYATLNNWDEVARHVKLINGLSTMIRDDAKELLYGPAQPQVAENRPAVYM